MVIQNHITGSSTYIFR